MTLSIGLIGFKRACGFSALLVSFLAFPTLTHAQSRHLQMPPMSRLPALPFKCRSADGSRDYPVVMVRQLEGDQNIYWATMRTLGIARDEAQALQMKCVSATPSSDASQTPVASPAPNVGPFTSFTMGAYFNAIYNGDLDSVRQLDKNYLGAMTTQLRAGGGMGDNPIWKKIIAAMQLDNASLLAPVIRIYLESYDSYYKNCLQKDAVTYRVTSTKQNMYGVAVDSSERSYTVNREFAQAFRDTSSEGLIPETTVLTAIAAMNSPYARVQAGLHELMVAKRCDDPAVKQFENRLLQMHTQIIGEPKQSVRR